MVGPHSGTPSGANVMHAEVKWQAKNSQVDPWTFLLGFPPATLCEVNSTPGVAITGWAGHLDLRASSQGFHEGIWVWGLSAQKILLTLSEAAILFFPLLIWINVKFG